MSVGEPRLSHAQKWQAFEAALAARHMSLTVQTGPVDNTVGVSERMHRIGTPIAEAGVKLLGILKGYLFRCVLTDDFDNNEEARQAAVDELAQEFSTYAVLLKKHKHSPGAILDVFHAISGFMEVLESGGCGLSGAFRELAQQLPDEQYIRDEYPNLRRGQQVVITDCIDAVLLKLVDQLQLNKPG